MKKILLIVLSMIFFYNVWAKMAMTHGETMQHVKEKTPTQFLTDHIKLMGQGKALDLATGTGRNAIYLAQQGFDVTAIDIDSDVLVKAKQSSKDKQLNINFVQADLEHYPLKPDSFDVIVVTNYLQRTLFPEIMKALKPGGVVMVETFDSGFLKYKKQFPKKYTLEKNELLNVFHSLLILRYQLVDDGKRVYASILAKK